MDFPSLKVRAPSFVAMFPQVDVLENSSESLSHAVILVIKDESVPGQPQSPRKNEYHVQPDGGGEDRRTAVLPGGTEGSSTSADPESSPKMTCRRTVNKNMCVGFQLRGTTFTIGLLPATNVFVVQSSSGVETSPKEKPREKLNFGRELAGPDERGSRY